MRQNVFKSRHINENILIRCYDDSMKTIGWVDEFRSFSWGYSWSGIGNWTLIADATSTHTIEVMRAATFIEIQNIPSSTLVNDIETVYGIVDKISNQYRISGDTVEITGYELKALANRRIILTAEEYPTKASAAIAKMLNTQLVNPQNADRRIVGGINTDFTISEVTCEPPQQYTNLSDSIVSIAEAAELGWHCAFGRDDDGNLGLVWFITDGYNRTTKQSVNNRMVLDFSAETIDAATYEIKLDGQNVAYVGGKGTGASRKIETATDDSITTGLHRVEIFTDARNEEDKALVGKGIEALNEYSGKTTIKIVPSFSFLQNFGETYNLGDVGTFIMPDGHLIDLRLTTAELNFENNSVTGSFTFGYDKSTLKQAMAVLLRSYKNMLNI